MLDNHVATRPGACRVAVIWIDWYPYHVARFRGLDAAPALAGRTAGLELVGGVGVHANLRFREELPHDLPVESLMPDVSWQDASQWQLARMLWRRLSQLDPEVVLVPGYYTLPALAAAAWSRLHGAASVLMTESCAMDHGRVMWKEKLKSVGLRLLFGWAVTGGSLHQDYLRDLGFPAARILDGYDVVDNDGFRKRTAALRADPAISGDSFHLPEKPYFLYVGRLAAEKNIAMLLQSWMSYRQAGGLWPLVLVGDGPEGSTLKAMAALSSHASDIWFAGLKTSKELAPFYAFAGCFVLPSVREPWGLVVNEAMAAALPVIVSSRCGCAPELVEPGRNGFTFDPCGRDAAAALTDALLLMAGFADDDRERMGEASAEIVRSFTPEAFGRSVAMIAGLHRQKDSAELVAREMA